MRLWPCCRHRRRARLVTLAGGSPVSILGALHVVDAIRSGAVCAPWHAAYAAFRRLRLPSPRQPPCLLYASDAAALHCPATSATLRIPFPLAPLARRPLLGSGHRVVLSASPSAGRACVVLLLHMPDGEVSFARLGDDRWTWVAPAKDDDDDDDAGLPSRSGYCDALYSAADGLFYLLRVDAFMCSLDLNGPFPVARKVLDYVPKSFVPTKYLLQTPAGDILQVWRTKDYFDSSTPVHFPPDYVHDGERGMDPCLELNSIEMQLYKVDLHRQRVELIKSLPAYALFLGFNGSMCLPVKDFPGLKPNSAYMTDDSIEYVSFYKLNRREIGIWSMAEQSMSKLVDVSPT